MTGVIEILVPLAAGAFALYLARRRQRGTGAWAAGAGVASLVFLILRVVVAVETDRPVFGPGGPEAGDHVYVVNADGTGKQRLTERRGDYRDPEWSPDGKSMVFSGRVVRGPHGIHTMNADGTNVRNLTGHGSVAALFPAWSPDGSRIAFLMFDPHKTSTICIMDNDGGNVRRLTDHTGLPPDLAWSPDGSKLACSVRTEERRHIRVLDAESGAPVDIAPPGGRVYELTWSPDSQRIAFHAFGGQTSVYLVRADGTDLVRLRTTVRADALAWSPDGKRIAFIGGDQVYLIEADGTGETALTPPGRYDFPEGLTWPPDGQRLAFWAYAKDAPYADLYVMNADGAALHSVATIISEEPRRKKLNLSSPLRGQAWRMLADPRNWPSAYSSGLLTTEGFRAPSGFCWSPDGNRLAYVSQAAAGADAQLLSATISMLTVPPLVLCAPLAVVLALRTWRRHGRTPGTLTGLITGAIPTVLYCLLVWLILSVRYGGMGGAG